MKRASLVTAAILLAFVAIAGWTGWWFFLATYGQRMAASGAEPTAEPKLAYAEIERFGFPFVVGLRLRDVKLAARFLDGTAHGTAPILELTARPWRPMDIAIQLPYGLGYSVTGQNRFSGEARLASGTAASKPAPAVALILTDVSARPPSSAPILARHGRIDWRRKPDGTAGLDLAFADLTLAENALFGPAAKRLETNLTLHGDLPVTGLPADIQAWRNAEGRIDIDAARVEWGALDLIADGKLGLDAAYRLTGGVNLKVGNGAATIGRLKSIGVLDAGGAIAANAYLAFGALASGGRAVAPVIFADGEASLAGFPIARLDPVCDCR